MNVPNKLEVQANTKKVFVVWTNTDLTEGRGSSVPLSVCEHEATALRLAKGAGVQGSNAYVRPFDAIKHCGEWCAPFNAKKATPEDLRAQKRLDEQAIAIAKAMAAGLSDDDIRALRDI